MRYMLTALPCFASFRKTALATMTSHSPCDLLVQSLNLISFKNRLKCLLLQRTCTLSPIFKCNPKPIIVEQSDALNEQMEVVTEANMGRYY